MRYLLAVLLLAGCCSKPVVLCQHPNHNKKAPEDLTGEMLNRKDIDPKFIKSYAKWVRYAHDRP